MTLLAITIIGIGGIAFAALAWRLADQPTWRTPVGAAITMLVGAVSPLYLAFPPWAALLWGVAIGSVGYHVTKTAESRRRR